MVPEEVYVYTLVRTGTFDSDPMFAPVPVLGSKQHVVTIHETDTVE